MNSMALCLRGMRPRRKPISVNMTGLRSNKRHRCSLILKTAVNEEHSNISTDYAVLVGANLFARNLLFVRMNSHLQARQLRFLG